MKRCEKQEHQEPAKNKASERRGDHWHNDFRPDASIPLYYRPIAARRRKCGPAKSADEGMTRTRRQTEPPRGDVPHKRSDDSSKNRRHRDNVGVDKAFADCRCHSAAKERACE